MAVQAGRAELPVVPVLIQRFSRDLITQMAGPAPRAATKTGRQTRQEFRRAAERTGADAGRRFGVRFNKGLGSGFTASSGIISKSLGGIAAAVGAMAIGSVFVDLVNDEREAARVSRQTEDRIRSTGGAANVTAAQITKLARTLAYKVGVDDDVIQSGQNMLLTFTNVRNEVGKGNDIFDRASAAVLDMTSFMNNGVVTQENLAKTSIQVGKALNDPIKGMGALSRVGVTFNKQQKEQITTMVEAGDTMGAQRLILAELTKEFGGAAEASADPWKRLAVIFRDVVGRAVSSLLPAIEGVADFLADKLIPAVEKFGKQHGPAFARVFNTIRDAIGGMIARARAWWATHGPAVEQAFDDAREAVFGVRGELDKTKKAWDDNSEAIQGLFGSVGDLTGSTGLPSLETILKRIGEEVRAAIQLAGWLARAWTIATKIVNKAITATVVTFVEANRTMIRGAAAVAEALHLPMAGALRKAEQRMGGFVADFKANSGEVSASAPGGSKSRFGQRLRAAERQMAGFRGSFNSQIGALKGKKITIPIKGTFQPPSGKFGSLHAIVGATGGYVTSKAIVHRANGGPIRMGTGPTADDVPAMLSRGEYVINAKATAKHRGLVEAINRDGLPGYARGGQVDVDVLTPKMGRFAARIQRIIDTIGNRTAALLERRLRIYVDGGVGGKASVKAFIRRADSLPYIWGGVGPGGYDCSGLTGEVMARHKGLPSFRRYFTTASIRAGQYGLKTGLGGVLDIGVTSGSGHMAGSYGGLGFEAESTRTGIKTGAAASRPSSFARKYHLAKGGPVDASMVDALARAGLLDVGGDPGRMRINGRIFDQGGTLAPGVNVVQNRTGRPEPLVPAGGIDYNRLGRAVADALRENPPVARVDDVHAGLLSKKRGQGGMRLGLD